jgi:hypothetical protein
MRALRAIARAPRFLGYGVTLEQRADGPTGVPAEPTPGLARTAAAAGLGGVGRLDTALYRARVQSIALSYAEGRLRDAAAAGDEAGDMVIVLGARLAQLCNVDAVEFNLPFNMRRATALFGGVPDDMDVLLAPDPSDVRNGTFTPVTINAKLGDMVIE